MIFTKRGRRETSTGESTVGARCEVVGRESQTSKVLTHAARPTWLIGLVKVCSRDEPE
jgi:hypothetical protein